MDLGAVKNIRQVDTFSNNQNANRGRQRFMLYGSSAVSDPGWNVEDARAWTPVAEVDTRKTAPSDFVATSLRRSGNRPLGSFQWLIWAVVPATTNAGGENTAFQEFQVLPAIAP
jgi:hypothetical protein